MGDFWTVHQVLKPILGPSSSHSSAPFLMGHILHLLLDNYGYSVSSLDDVLDMLHINIYCSNPSREMYSFVGHRSIRALILGLLGGYFSSGKREIFARNKHILESIREYDLIHNMDVNFEPLGDKDVAYTLSISFVEGERQISASFDSIGGGIIDLGSIDAKIIGPIEKLFDEPVPLWLYLSRDSIMKIEDFPLDKSIIDDGRKFLDNGDIILSKESSRGSLGSYLFERENRIIKNSKIIMEEALDIMMATTEKTPEKLRYSKFLKYEIEALTLDTSDVLGKLQRYTLNVAVNNAEMNIVVSAPTGGASSIVPAVLRTLRENWGVKGEELLHSLYTAGFIGGYIGNNMSVSGSRHGCQAEIGVSLAMASAMIVDALLENRSFEDRISLVLNSATIALQAIQGLACDPLMGFVEVPCVLRNLSLVYVPISVSRLILSGYRPIIALRTAIRALKKTGELLSRALRESGTGPLTAMYILSKIEKKGIEEELIQLFEEEVYW